MELNLHLTVRARALLVGLLCGLAGVAVDVDHIYEHFTQIGLEPVFIIPGFFDGRGFTDPGRPLHSLIFYSCCVAIPCLGGLLFHHSLSTFVKIKTENLILWTRQRIMPQIIEE